MGFGFGLTVAWLFGFAAVWLVFGLENVVHEQASLG